MIISYSRRFAIFAPWKTASSTMAIRLAEFNESPYSRFYHFNRHLNRIVHQHLTYADYAAMPESRLGLFTAAFIRNPYDRVYSGFRQMQRAALNQPVAVYPERWVRDLVIKQVAGNSAKLREAAFDFDRWWGGVNDYDIFDAGHNISFSLHPAHYWTHSNGQQMVDFVGRVETFEADFDRLCSRIGITVTNRQNANVDVDPAHTGGAYKSAGLMSAASIARINELFREDFDLFGYQRLDPTGPRLSERPSAPL
jgi:hypothetical protein